MSDFDDWQKREDQRRGAKGVFIVLLAITGTLIGVGLLANFLKIIGGNFQP